MFDNLTLFSLVIKCASVSSRAQVMEAQVVKSTINEPVFFNLSPAVKVKIRTMGFQQMVYNQAKR